MNFLAAPVVLLQANCSLSACVDKPFSVIAILRLKPAILPRSQKINLIAVTDDAASPQLAAQLLQSLSRLYLEKHMRVDRVAGQFHFFDRQTAESRQQLEDAQSAKVGVPSRVRTGALCHHSDLRQAQGLAGMSRSRPRKLPERFVLQASEV
ncbi:MAG TPA: hypothetical protein VMU26_10025 [Candidatus Polarisedimenticolia bacterium]|nr:hypothetical protein [Candidatus Polarisedimenticolia bacterium]